MTSYPDDFSLVLLFREMNILIYLFDITNKNALKLVSSSLEQFKIHGLGMYPSCVLLVRNKADLTEKREISLAKIKCYANNNHMQYIEISATEDKGFTILLEQVLKISMKENFSRVDCSPSNAILNDLGIMLEAKGLTGFDVAFNFFSFSPKNLEGEIYIPHKIFAAQDIISQIILFLKDLQATFLDKKQWDHKGIGFFHCKMPTHIKRLQDLLGDVDFNNFPEHNLKTFYGYAMNILSEATHKWHPFRFKEVNTIYHEKYTEGLNIIKQTINSVTNDKSMSPAL